MDKLNIELTNCFGIKTLTHEFGFDNGKVFTIYARNGLMKTSFAKTFQFIQNNDQDEIGDKIFGYNGNASVKIDGNDIRKEQVFVIRSYENSYESDISSLLIKDEVKEQLNEVLRARTELLKALEKESGLKIKKTYLGKITYELESQIINDFSFLENSILLNLDELESYIPEIQFDGIKYSLIFDSTVLKKIRDPKFQEGLADFISASDEIYDSFEYLEKGCLTLPKLKDLKKSLEKDSFFIKDNHIVLSGGEEIADITSLNNTINEIETRIQQLPEYREIEKMLSDAKGIVLKDVIETHPEIIEYLSIDKLDILRKSLWSSYIRDNGAIFSDLCRKYREFYDSINTLTIDETPWKKALDIFNQRFTVPFSMSVANLKGAIIGESVPKVEFTFRNETDCKTINRSKLEELDTLSQGEKRALYLLNIIFDIEQLKESGQEILLVIDDIADSFDYKNKYAIIEYLYELSHEDNFYMLILSHNFDFYRTVSNRLGIDRHNHLMTNLRGSAIILEEEIYQRNPFQYWKMHPNKKFILALIPFVRNIIEYGKDRNVSGTENDFKFLTALLHEKSTSNILTFADIEPLYKEYMGAADFGDSVVPTDKVLDILYNICDEITLTDTNLENKIILAMGIRHKAEVFMISQISGYTGQLNWQRRTGSGTDFLAYVGNTRNQTRELVEGYQQFGAPEKLKILDEVNIMTPEHIHINSFMYEPLLDMDITELLGLYQKVKSL